MNRGFATHVADYSDVLRYAGTNVDQSLGKRFENVDAELGRGGQEGARIKSNGKKL
jgi:hypothetical protein